ncbi:TRAM domain-containing protein, partial [Paenibacillus macerans]|nr:TRAM domain-containing protein [Paenibacillus macerans]
MTKQRKSFNAGSGGRAGGGTGKGGRRSGSERPPGSRGQAAGSGEKYIRKAAAVAELPGLPVAKNDELVIDIIGMNHDGEGVGRAEGYTLFVAGALPGEKARVRVLKTKKQYGYAKLLDVVQASPDRVPAPCPIYDQCGGCQ